jgi:hypothetical protein
MPSEYGSLLDQALPPDPDGTTAAAGKPDRQRWRRYDAQRCRRIGSG